MCVWGGGRGVGVSAKLERAGWVVISQADDMVGHIASVQLCVVRASAHVVAWCREPLLVCGVYCFTKELPKLWFTARVCHAFSLRLLTKRDEMKATMKLSCRGAIRQAPSVLTWINTLLNMQTWGVNDTANLMREWNKTAARADQLTGGRAQAVQLVLERMPQPVLDKLQASELTNPFVPQHVSPLH